MAIYRLIADGSFGSDEIEVRTAAYQGALIERINRALLCPHRIALACGGQVND